MLNFQPVFPANICSKCEICSTLTVNIREWRHWLWTYLTPFSIVSLGDFEQVNVSCVSLLNINLIKPDAQYAQNVFIIFGRFSRQFFEILQKYTKRSSPNFQKQPSRGILRKRCTENIQQIFRRQPMPKCDLIKLLCNPEVFLGKAVLKICNALELYWNHTSTWVFSCKFATYFQNSFSWERLWVAATEFCF